MRQKSPYEDLEKQVIDLQKKALRSRYAEQALHAMEARYRRLINAVTDYVFTVHLKDGRPVALNSTEIDTDLLDRLV